MTAFTIAYLLVFLASVAGAILGGCVLAGIGILIRNEVIRMNQRRAQKRARLKKTADAIRLAQYQLLPDPKPPLAEFMKGGPIANPAR